MHVDIDKNGFSSGKRAKVEIHMHLSDTWRDQFFFAPFFRFVFFFLSCSPRIFALDNLIIPT